MRNLFAANWIFKLKQFRIYDSKKKKNILKLLWGIFFAVYYVFKVKQFRVSDSKKGGKIKLLKVIFFCWLLRILSKSIWVFKIWLNFYSELSVIQDFINIFIGKFIYFILCTNVSVYLYIVYKNKTCFMIFRHILWCFPQASTW